MTLNHVCTNPRVFFCTQVKVRGFVQYNNQYLTVSFAVAQDSSILQICILFVHVWSHCSRPHLASGLRWDINEHISDIPSVLALKRAFGVLIAFACGCRTLTLIRHPIYFVLLLHLTFLNQACLCMNDVGPSLPCHCLCK